MAMFGDLFEDGSLDELNSLGIVDEYEIGDDEPIETTSNNDELASEPESEFGSTATPEVSEDSEEPTVVPEVSGNEQNSTEIYEETVETQAIVDILQDILICQQINGFLLFVIIGILTAVVFWKGILK